MIPVKHIDPEDLPLYAMQLLPPEEMAELTENLQHSVEARRVLSEIYGDLSLFALSVEMQNPSAESRQRLLKHVGREKKAIPIDRAPVEETFAPRSAATLAAAEVRPRGLAGRILPWVGWAIAAGMLLEAGNLYQDRERLQRTVAMDRMQLEQTQISAEQANTVLATIKDPTAVRVTLTGTGVKPPPEGRVNYVTGTGSLIFVASNLEPLQPSKTYELWLIPADGQAPVPAGTFRPDERGNASVVLPPLAKGLTAKAFGVTVEEGDGSLAPTMPILLQGLAS